MLKRISSSVHGWIELHGESRNQPYTWNSHLIQVKGKNVLALIDPLPLSTDEVREVEGLGKPTHILLTCNYHLRESEAFRQKWGCKVLLHQEGLKGAEAGIDGTFQDREMLWRLIEAIQVPNVHYPEEVAFLVQEDGGVLVVGDILCGGRKDRGVPDGELWINGPEYVADLQRARISLQGLLDYPFETLCFGHGSPITRRPKEVLKRFVESDDVWKKLRTEKAERSRSLPL